MSAFQPPTFEEAKLTFKPLRRSRMVRTRDSLSPSGKASLRNGIARKRASGLKRRSIKSSAVPYGSLSVSKKKKAKKKRLTDGQLKKRVWREFSIFVRTRNASPDGINRCFTCPTYLHWKELQAGHFVRGRLNANLFDERGCQPQCHRCNIHFQGNVVVYYGAMRELYGQEVIDKLIQQNYQTKKWAPGELASLLEKYKTINAANPLIERKPKTGRKHST